MWEEGSASTIYHPPHPATNAPKDAWKEYWQGLGQPWRTEPEIDDDRKRALTELRSGRTSYQRDAYPFANAVLSRADIEWLLTTHEDKGTRGPVKARLADHDEAQWGRNGLDLRGADLRRIDLSDLPLDRLWGALIGDWWTEASPEQRDAAAMRVEEADLHGVWLQEARLRQVRFGSANLRGAHLEYADLNEAVLERADLSESHLEETHLRRANLRESICRAAHFERAILKGADLQQANLAAAWLTEARLRGAHLERANLSAARLTGAYLRAAHLEQANLWGADLQQADLTGANLIGADLRGADLRGADLTRAKLDNTNLQGADLRAIRRHEEDSHKEMSAHKEDEAHYTLWIEAEEWAPGEWRPEDDSSDVLVTRPDGSRWVATFFSYQNIRSLANKNKQTGECLAGAYFWASDMILIDEVSRKRIEEVIRDLVQQGNFETVFTRLPDPDQA